ncbi:TonB-dependent receptor [Sphingomonas sp. AP4-R1]|uniref:TonB-dependent receptor plug domain-containing protein n=1 Tax=Sphingomonas sp. AP4-R1 TaxID=2735134 RepID=UPI001493D799|nr:TonB-dependent receptor [Sphingomonas sp. AP4-R1]QJU58363.1 TonB-dependent receptor [Sphingomonas sp. AP4-R1]
MNRITLSALCLGSASMLALSAPALAQQAETPPAVGSSTATPAESEAPTPAAAEDIVVTGSRIVRSGYNAPTPVTVVSTDQLTKTAPSNVPDALNQLPQFQGSISAAAQADTGASRVRSGNYLDIRALGPQRVLILEDGKRLPPTSSNGATDANLIPQMLVDRVEVVTGGASAAYGSDAVSGVVNFIMNKKFTGLKLNVQGGLSTYGDNGSYKAGAAGGISLMDDRLHVIGSAEFYHANGVTDRSSRFTSSGQNTESAFTIAGLGTAAAPYYYIGGIHNNAQAYGGYIVDGPLAGLQFLPNGQTAPFTKGTTLAGRPGYGVGGDGIVNPSVSRTGVPTLETVQLFGRAQYELADDLTAFAEVSYNTGANADKNGTPGTIGQGAMVFRDNAYLTDGVRAALGSTQSFVVGRPFAEWSLNDQSQKSRNTVINAGLEGKIAGFHWNAYYTHGKSSFRTKSLGIDNQRFYAAVDAVRNGAGQIVCRVTVTNPTLYPGCVPLNIIGVGSSSVEAQNWVRRYSTWNADNKMDLGALSISGEPFSLWAGPVGVAFGVEYRRQTLNQTSNSNPATAVDFTGLRGVTSTNQFQSVNVGFAKGSYNVKEVFGEVDVPLAKDSAIGSLDLNGAVRLTDYSTSGSVTTWKVGTTYQPIPDIRLRATLSRDIRAPSLFELFAGRQQTTSPLTDLHTGLSQTVNVISSGNRDLQPEVATTYTIGAVLSPSFLRGFNFSVDYYNIKIKDAISQPFTYIQLADFCEQSNGTSPLCAQVIRPFGFDNRTAANFPTEIRLQNLNLARTQTSGLDLEGSYRGEVAGGAFMARLLATRLISYRQQNSTVLPERQYAGNADFIQGFYPLPMPKWRGTMNVSYALHGVSVGVQERYVGAFHISDIFQYVNNKVKSTYYTDLNLSVDIGGTQPKGMQVYVTVNNVFNQKGRLFLISPVPGLNIPTARSIYDIIGTYLTAGVKVGF